MGGLPAELLRSAKAQRLHCSATNDAIGTADRRLTRVARAMHGTGLGMLVHGTHGVDLSAHELFESEVAVKELRWRLRQIGRELAFELSSLQTRPAICDEVLVLLRR